MKQNEHSGKPIMVLKNWKFLSVSFANAITSSYLLSFNTSIPLIPPFSPPSPTNRRNMADCNQYEERDSTSFLFKRSVSASEKTHLQPRLSVLWLLIFPAELSTFVDATTQYPMGITHLHRKSCLSV